jgi:hypothetical protein
MGGAVAGEDEEPFRLLFRSVVGVALVKAFCLLLYTLSLTTLSPSLSLFYFPFAVATMQRHYLAEEMKNTFYLQTRLDEEVTPHRRTHFFTYTYTPSLLHTSTPSYTPTTYPPTHLSHSLGVLSEGPVRPVQCVGRRTLLAAGHRGGPPHAEAGEEQRVGRCCGVLLSYFTKLSFASCYTLALTLSPFSLPVHPHSTRNTLQDVCESF